MKVVKIFLVMISFLFANDTLIFFPKELNIQPFTANILEPRMGFMFKNNVNELRLDIGSSQDLLWYQFDKKTLSFGADFFTYSLLRKEKDFHFPVDAIDYLFGVNFGLKNLIEGQDNGLRFRISHISTHMVDGHVDNYRDFDSTKPLKWRNNIPAKVYSREFIELIYYYFFSNLKLYAGYTYVFHIDPTYLGRNIYNAGFEYYYNDLLMKDMNLFVAYNIKIHKVDYWKGDNNLEIGLKLGNYKNKGVAIYWCYYNGYNFHGQYHKYLDNYNGIGINFDL